jgi:hypothetical protein
MLGRRVAIFPLVVSLACALLLLQMALSDARFFIPLALVLLTTIAPVLLAQRRMRRLFLSGDVHSVLDSWRRSIERVMYPETMAPLMIATAYASYGWIDAARKALGRAQKGPAWDAAIEQRLFVETLLDTFEGDQAAALSKATALTHLPMPATGPLARRRVSKLRDGVLAMVRAFQHTSREDDLRALEEAGRVSPLVHWAMRYAAAIVAIDHGSKQRATTLLADAPKWPAESAFKSFDDELRGKLAAA